MAAADSASSTTPAATLTQDALRMFASFKGKEDLVRVYVEAANELSKDELKTFTDTFIKYDVNKSGDLDEFELNKMYESRGETKTSAQMKELIRSIGEEFKETLRANGVTYNAYLSIMLKDKKGVNKTQWGSFATIAKRHDDTKATGRIANIFEKHAASGNSEEAKRKADIELRKQANAIKRDDDAKKKAKKEALARFSAGLNKTNSNTG